MIIKVASLLWISSSLTMKIVNFIATETSILAIAATVTVSDGILAIDIVVLREIIMKKLNK